MLFIAWNMAWKMNKITCRAITREIPRLVRAPYSSAPAGPVASGPAPSVKEAPLPPPPQRIPHGRIPRKMPAWQIHGYGTFQQELQLASEARVPVIRNPNDVLVKIHAASVNPIDVKMVGGYGSKALNFLRRIDSGLEMSGVPEFPLTLGRDFSGVVVGKGHAVETVEVGQPVWGVSGPQRQGTHAGYVLISSDGVTPRPTNLSDIEAATFPYAALTAWSALRLTGGVSKESASKQRFLVIGASGGVGTIVVQILRAWKAQVVATCSSDAVELVSSLGADRVVDYKQPDAQEALLADGKYDLVLDLSGKLDPTRLDLLKEKSMAKYVSLTHPLLHNMDGYGLALGLFKSASEVIKPNLSYLTNGKSMRWAVFTPNPKALRIICKMVCEKQVKPVVDKVFPFEETQAAYEKVSQGHARGKTVINMS